MTVTPFLLIAACLAVGAAVGLALDRTVSIRFVTDAGPRSRALVGVATGAVWALLAWRSGATSVLPALLYLGAVGVALVRIDLAVHRLPDVLTLPSYGVGIVLLAAATAADGHVGPLLHALLGMVAAFVVYLVLALINPRGIGLGDVKLSGFLGLVTGWFGLSAWWLGMLGGFVLGGLGGVLLLLARRATRRSEIAFGPAMIAGAILAVLAGAPLAHAYTTALP